MLLLPAPAQEMYLLSGSDAPQVAAARDASVTQPELPSITNTQIADSLEEVAQLLETRDGNPYRIGSYRRAAAIVRGLPRSLSELLERDGLGGLQQLSGIGPSLAGAITELARDGHLRLLDHLRRQVHPSTVLSTVAGLGPGLAMRVHDQLGIDNLPELQAAALDGRLATVPGMGKKRIRAVIECLRGRGRVPEPITTHSEIGTIPPVQELLDVDREYREKSARGSLRKIAPRRFNPTAEAWLPILHTKRGGRSYTALYSNTARAHEMGTTHDWVVIYLDDDSNHYQCTVITARFGALAGSRVVCGRERECQRLL